MKLLNQELGFDEVRWATTRRTSYDVRSSFDGVPQKTRLKAGTRLYRLLPLAVGDYFSAVWWMPKEVFEELLNDVRGSKTGGGALLRNYVAQYLALPSANQLCVVEIELVRDVYAWIGRAAPLFGRPGGMTQVYLPNLAERGNPRHSSHARLVRTYWLRF